MALLRRIWNSYTTSGIKLPAGSIERNRVLSINIFSSIGFVTELSFGILNITNHNYSAGGIEIAAALVMLTNIILLRRNHNVHRAARILIITVAAPLMTMFLTTSTYNTNLFWLPAFPVAAYLVLGRQQGSTALFILLVTIGALTLLESLQLVELAYSFISIRQIAISLLVLTVLLYVHESLRDQSMQKAGEKALTLYRAYQEARQSEKMREEYTMTLAHELRNSLVAIQKLAQTWRDQHASISPERAREYTGLIHQSATENLAAVNSLLDIFNIERTGLKVEKSLSSLREIVNQQISLFEPQAKELKLKLAMEFDDEIPWQIPMDSFRIKEVITNLISNALKHTQPGNTISIQAIKAINHDHLQQRAQELKVTWYINKNEKKLAAKSNFVFIGVSHPEKGISKDDIGKLFKKFSQLQPSDQLHPPKGHGLGLYIIRQIIESHGGVYGVASKAGQGVTFYVTLPLGETEQTNA